MYALRTGFASITIIAASIAGTAQAAVNAEEAKLLGNTLTLWGAEKAGNKEGTIPPYTGEPITPPASFNAKEPRRLPSPWDDKPLFSITPQNMGQYADKMTEGQKAMFKKFPGFRMDVYKSRRPMIYPKYVLDNSIKNATACKGGEGELTLVGCYGGVPFPIPKTGNQVMWNHLATYMQPRWHSITTAWVVDTSGKAIMQGTNDAYNDSPYYDPKRTTPSGPNEIYWRVRWNTLEPPRKAGEKYVIIDPLDQVNIGRRAYVYIPGQRRVKLSPDLAYDTPNPISGGAATMDQSILFTGALDRYDFKLAGKKEKYIMYNNFQLTDYQVCPDEKALTKNFLNPDCNRWELHRVWVVEATLKSGFRHIMPKRTLYFDEDTFLAGSSDDYDASGSVFRFTSEGMQFAYDIGSGSWGQCAYITDLNTGVWTTTCLQGKPGLGWGTDIPRPSTFFTPEAIAAEGIR